MFWSGEPTGQILGRTHYQGERTFSPLDYFAAPSDETRPRNIQAASMVESALPTSWNLRNRALQETQKIGRQPIGNLVAGGVADKFMSELLPSVQNTRAMLAARGLLGGGASDLMRRRLYQNISGGMGQAIKSGYDADRKQRNLFLSMLDSQFGNDLKMLDATRNYVDPRSYQQATILESQNARANTQRWADLASDIGAFGLGFFGNMPASTLKQSAAGSWGNALQDWLS